MEQRPHAVNIPMPQYNVASEPTANTRSTGVSEVYTKLLKDLVDSSNKNMCLNYDTKEECHSARNTVAYITKKNEFALNVYERNGILWVIKKA